MKKILIVDDEIEMLESLNKILSYRKEFQLTLVNDSQQGLDLVQKQKFDLIISDLKMHPVSGLEILKGAIKNFPDSLVIMISGYGTNYLLPKSCSVASIVPLKNKKYMFPANQMKALKSLLALFTKAKKWKI
jgi:DNA-binding NtrC family response regulator